MQRSFKKQSDFFERIQKIIDYKGIKSVNEFALNHLKYDAPQKINRLKQEGTSPSYEILVDIVNKFEEINPLWLLTGKGDMLIAANATTSTNQTNEALKKLVDAQEKTIKLLEEQLEAERTKDKSTKQPKSQSKSRLVSDELISKS